MSETRQPECYAAVTVTLGAATLTLLLRFVARKLKRISLSYDDYLIIVAFIAAIAYDAAEYKWLEVGLGLHLADLSITTDEIFYYCSLFQWVMEHAYSVAIAASQLSLLALYWRAFESITGARFAIIGLISCAAIWLVCRLFIVTFQCFPPQAKWDKSVEGSCSVDTGKFFLATVTTHLILDVCMMILPACLIGTLRLPWIQKISITAMFMFGGIVCICSVMMILESVHYDAASRVSNDLMWMEVGPANWSAVEINLSIITACLPLMRPIFRFVSSGFQSIHSRTAESQRSQSFKLNEMPDFVHCVRTRSDGGSKWTGEDVITPKNAVIHGQDSGLRTKISGGNRFRQLRDSQWGTMDGIHVTNDLDFRISRAV